MKVNRSKKKLRIKETLESLGTTLPETLLDKLILWLQNKQVEYTAKGYGTISFHFIAEWDGPDEIFLIGFRDETDKEYGARMKAIEKEERSEAVKMQEHVKFIEKEAKKLGILK